MTSSTPVDDHSRLVALDALYDRDRADNRERMGRIEATMVTREVYEIDRATTAEGIRANRAAIAAARKACADGEAARHRRVASVTAAVGSALLFPILVDIVTTLLARHL